jgi:hypothetical protein
MKKVQIYQVIYPRRITTKNFFSCHAWKQFLFSPRPVLLIDIDTKTVIIKASYQKALNGFYSFFIEIDGDLYIWTPTTENWSGLPLGILTKKISREHVVEISNIEENEKKQGRMICMTFVKILTADGEYTFQEKRKVNRYGFSSLTGNPTSILNSSGIEILSTKFLSDTDKIIEVKISPSREINLLLAIMLILIVQAPMCHFGGRRDT